jgi:hypothetical protein
MPYFLCTTDRRYGIQLQEGYVVLIGSGAGNTLTLAPEFNLAAEHYAVYHHTEGLWLENRMGDPAELWVNGHPAAALALKPGDLIRSGCLTLLLEQVELPDNGHIQPLAWPPPLPKVDLVDHLRVGAIPPPRSLSNTDLTPLPISGPLRCHPPAPAAPQHSIEAKTPPKPEAVVHSHVKVIAAIPKPMPLSR